MHRRIWILSSLLLIPMAHAAENRLYVADQSDFNAKRGFYVSFENNAPDGAPCKLETLRLVLAVADGKQWQFAVTTLKFSMGELLRLHAVIAGGKGSISLNDSLVGEITNGLSPSDHPFSAGDVPSWASAPADYRLYEHLARIT